MDAVEWVIWLILSNTLSIIWWNSFNFWVAGTLRCCSFQYNQVMLRKILFWPSDFNVLVSSSIIIDRKAGETIRLPVRLSVWVCETYIVHYLVSTGLPCAPLTCVVHHQPALCTMVHKGDPCQSQCLSGFVKATLYNADLSVSVSTLSCFLDHLCKLRGRLLCFLSVCIKYSLEKKSYLKKYSNIYQGQRSCRSGSNVK